MSKARELSELADTVEVDGSGNVAFASGLHLGGTGAANLLDDYEEGTWTGTLISSSSTTYTSNLGSYLKVGNLVFVAMDFEVDNYVDGDGRIAGLPFPSAGTTSALSVAFFDSLGANVYSLFPRIDSGDNKIQFAGQQGLDNAIGNVGGALRSNNARIIFSGTYSTA